jgi:hypothetical protein
VEAALQLVGLTLLHLRLELGKAEIAHLKHRDTRTCVSVSLERVWCGVPMRRCVCGGRGVVDLDVPFGVEQQVEGLEIAVHDPGPEQLNVRW